MQGHLFSVSQARYIAPVSVDDITLPSVPDFILASVFLLPEGEKPIITADWMQDLVKTFGECDDVFDRAFLDLVIFAGPTRNNIVLTEDARQYLRELGNQQVEFIASTELLPGPYATVAGQLRDVWMLVDDSNGTCITPLKPQLSAFDKFEQFRLTGTDHQSPLAGLRIVIKDNIHLQGIKTSAGNRAFYETYSPREQSADCIQDLINQGVSIVGTTKMNSFGNWEEPTEYIDYQAPRNPRGDRYQSTGGSSSGSASAIASYDWLDIAIGTDTWGSITRPALWCGCFGLRPSIGAISGTGIEPCVSAWDTPGILCRDLQKCIDFASEWLARDLLEPDPKPYSSILWPEDFWNVVDLKQTCIAREFIKSIESTLNISCESTSFQETWARAPPAEANGHSLTQFINPAMAALAYEAYHNGADFRACYYKKYNHAPYTSPRNQETWAAGKEVSKAARDKGFSDIEIYYRWFQHTVLAGRHSRALIILPLESMTPRYRDKPPTFRRPPQDGIHALALGPVMKAPVLAVPSKNPAHRDWRQIVLTKEVAEIPYQSDVTQREEMLPFAVAIMAPAGSDLLLMDVVQKVLRAAGLPTIVKTGRSMF